MKAKGLFFVVSALLLTGCTNSESELEKNLCAVKSLDLEENKKQCQVGARIAYLPRSFGNEQLPVIFAATHCDHTRSIALTNGAVSCIFSPAKETKK